MMIRSLVALYLVTSLSFMTGLSQTGATAASHASPTPRYIDTGQLNDDQLGKYVGNMYTLDPNRPGDAEMPRKIATHNAALSELYQRAVKGDGLAAFYMAKECTGPSFAGVKSDYPRAVQWLQRGVEHGNLASKYRLAGFYSEGKGGLPRDIHKAAQLEYEATNAGYNPRHPPGWQIDQDATLNAILGVGAVLLFLGAVGAVTGPPGGSGPDSSSPPQTSFAQCQVPIVNYVSGETTYRTAYGSACNQVGARIY